MVKARAAVRTFFHVSQEPLCVSSKHSSARLFSPQTRTCAPTACGGDGAVSLKRRSYCDLLCCTSARACFAEAEDPAAYLKLWDLAVTCAHRPTTHAAEVGIREVFFVVRLQQRNNFGDDLHGQTCSVSRSRIGRSAVFDSSRMARVSHSFLLFLRSISLRFCESGTCRGHELGRQDSKRYSLTWRSPLLHQKGRGTTRLNVLIGAAAEIPAMALRRRWSMCKLPSASHTLRLLRTRNGVPTKRCQHVLQWRGAKLRHRIVLSALISVRLYRKCPQ